MEYLLYFLIYIVLVSRTSWLVNRPKLWHVIKKGDLVYNLTDGSTGKVKKVISATTIKLN
jgi:hypothetical protein